jgi:hypothetical protein
MKKVELNLEYTDFQIYIYIYILLALLVLYVEESNKSSYQSKPHL